MSHKDESLELGSWREIPFKDNITILCFPSATETTMQDLRLTRKKGQLAILFNAHMKVLVYLFAFLCFHILHFFSPPELDISFSFIYFPFQIISWNFCVRSCENEDINKESTCSQSQVCVLIYSCKLSLSYEE
jgi:hypothetical protein